MAVGRDTGRIACLTSCVVACFSTTALTTLITLFATSSLEDTSVHGLALSASVVDILALGALLVFTISQLRRSSRGNARTQKQTWSTIVVVILPSLLGLVLSIIVLAWMRPNIHHLESLDSHISISNLLGAGLAMWVVALLSQGIFYVLWLCHHPALPDAITSSSETGAYHVSTNERKRSPSISMSVLPPPTYHPSFVPGSPTLSACSGAASLRDSVHQFIKPVTSRTRLIRQSSFPKDTASIYSDAPTEIRQESDGFETWEVEPVPAADTINSSPLTRHMPQLETIPGSRPVSPARPLDGPFPDDPSPEEVPLPDSPLYADLQQPPVYIPRTGSTSAGNSPTAATFAPPFAALVRRPSGPNTAIANDQLHIHPLFRTDSPTPPPVASPGTIVMASAFAGQVVTELDHPRGRKGSVWSNASRPGSPAGSRPGSARSHRQVLRSTPSYGETSMRLAMAERTPTPPMPMPMPIAPPLVCSHRRKESV